MTVLKAFSASVFFRSKVSVLLILIFISLLWPALRSISIVQDFDVFYGAAKKLTGHVNIYKEQYVYGYWYYYSVAFAGILAPFTYFPVEFSKALWSLLNLWMIFRVFKNIFQFSKTDHHKKSFYKVLGLCWFLFFYLLYVNITSGQVTVLILFLCLEGYKQLQKGNTQYSGTLIAAGINIKLLPVVLVIPWLQARQYRALFWGMVFFLFLLFIPLLLIDFGYYKDLTLAWLDKINPFHNDHIEEVGEGGFIDLAGIVTKYFCSFKIREEIIISWFNFSKSQLFWVTNLLRLALVASLTILSYKIQQHQKSKNLSFTAFALWLGIIPVIVPHQRDYSLLFLSPLIILLLKEFFNNKIKSVYLFLFALSGLLMTLHPLIFIKNKMLTQFVLSFRIQGIGALVFICTCIVKLMKDLRFSLKESEPTLP